jgi:hypothetical protein
MKRILLLALVAYLFYRYLVQPLLAQDRRRKGTRKDTYTSPPYYDWDYDGGHHRHRRSETDGGRFVEYEEIDEVDE